MKRPRIFDCRLSICDCRSANADCDSPRSTHHYVIPAKAVLRESGGAGIHSSHSAIGNPQSAIRGRSRRTSAYCLLPPAYCLLFSAFCFLLCSCGYHVAGKGVRIPTDVKTIAVPAFENKTSRYRIEQWLSAAVTRELIDRTKFRIVSDPAGADAVLRGTVKDIRSGVITFDLQTGRATALQIQVTTTVALTDLHTQKTIFANNNYVFREEYQVSQTAPQLFEEDEPALKRLSRDLARTLVTEILENF